MASLRPAIACTRARLARIPSTGSARALPRRCLRTTCPPPRRFPRAPTAIPRTRRRAYAAATTSPRTASAIVEELEELYDAAHEELQIATEETAENTIYAAEDRAAAREALDRLKGAFESAVGDAEVAEGVKEEVRRRAGQRVREMESAVAALEERAKEDG